MNRQKTKDQRPKTEKVKKLFKKVKLLILDVDGVLTRGEIIYDSQGHDLKVFNAKDGLGVFLLSLVGIKVVLITAINSKVVKRRASDMHIDKVYEGILPKEKLLPQIRKIYGLSDKDICFVGDDLIDIGIMKKVGLGVAVNDAPDEVKKAAIYVTKNKGGEGAVREVVELLLKSKNLWSMALKSIAAVSRGKQ